MDEAIITHCAEDSSGLYLLFVSFYLRLDHEFKPLQLSEGHSASDTAIFQQFLRNLPKLTILTPDGLRTCLSQDHPEPVVKLANWIHSNFGGMFSTAPNALKIPGFPRNIRQFVVLDPPANIKRRFDASVKHHEGKTSVRFHGTSISSLQGILHDGFMTNRIWTADCPTISYGYAFERRPILEKQMHPLWNYGVLLGLEVAESSCLVIKDAPHAERDDYMVRYIFIMHPGASLPSRTDSIGLAMKAAFRRWPGKKDEN